MASPSLALPGKLFVGEDERARLVMYLGPAAGWMAPKGVLGWSHEVSVVARDALTEDIRRDTKLVMPEAQIPPARMPLAHQAAQRSPLVAVSGKLVQRLVDAGIRVHTIGADRVTSSFYYIAEGGGEEPVRVEGDLVAAVGAMLGDRADNAAIERVLDGLVDRLLRSLSRDRLSELSLELAASLPRAAADGTGTQDIDLEAFEKELTALVGTSEKYTSFLQEIATKIGDTNDRKVDIPLFGDARKVSQGPFELTVGVQKVALVTHERWLATGPLTEPARAAPAPAPAPTPSPAPAPAKAAASPAPAPVHASPAPAPANIRPLAAPMNPPRPASNPPPKEEPKVEAAPAAKAAEPAPAPKAAEPAPAAKAAEPAPKAEPAAAKPEAKTAAKVEPKAEPKPEPKAAKAESKAAAEPAPIARPEKGGVPWLWIVVIAAAAVAVWRFFIAKH
jgi:hypothetical protein